MENFAKGADVGSSLEGAMRKYKLVDVTGALRQYEGAKTAVCGCVARNINTAYMVAAFIILEEAIRSIK